MKDMELEKIMAERLRVENILLALQPNTFTKLRSFQSKKNRQTAAQMLARKAASK